MTKPTDEALEKARDVVDAMDMHRAAWCRGGGGLPPSEYGPAIVRAAITQADAAGFRRGLEAAVGLPPKPTAGMPIDKTDDWERRQDERRDPGAGEVR
jgi:hypothetical protein